MRLSIARILVVITLFVWIIVFPLAVLRILVQFPNLYQRWMRDGDVYDKSGQAISITALRQIPQDAWSPWINRHPIVIHNVFNRLVDQATFEETMAAASVCWVEWWLGVEQPSCYLMPEVEAAIDPAQWERIRAYLWETLPSCTEASPPACLPLEPGDYAANGQQQSAWWEIYQPAFVQGFIQAEAAFVAALPQPPPRALVFNWTLSATLILTIVAFFLTAFDLRALYMSSVFYMMGGSALAVGTALASGLLHYQYLLLWLDIPTFDVIEILLPQIWPALAHLLGMTFLLTGCITIVPGLCGLSLLTSQRFLRVVLPTSSLVLLFCAIALYPESAFSRAPDLPIPAPQSTPTPWPTLTLTPTNTPTPTPTSLPLSEGTPLPLPGADWWQAPDVLRCTALTANPIEAIRFHADALSIIQNGLYLRFNFSESEFIFERRLPRAFDLLLVSPSGNLAGLAEGRDLWLYALPDWIPVVRSRISTLSPITSIVFTPDESHVIMGLQNGYIWVTDVQTGELVTIFPALQSAITALAPHNVDNYLYTGAENGLVQIWDIRNRQLIRNLDGHTAQIQAIVPSSSEAMAITLDITNRFILWQASAGQTLRERKIAVDLTSNLLWFDDPDVDGRNGIDTGRGFVVGGTMDGQVFQLDGRFAYRKLLKLESSITVLEAVGEDYLIVGTADGRYCVVGSPQ